MFKHPGLNSTPAHGKAFGGYVIVRGYQSKRRKSPKPTTYLPGFTPSELVSMVPECDNGIIAGVDGATTPAPPNQNREEPSAMTSLNATLPDTLSQTTPTVVTSRTYSQDWPAYNAAQTSEKDNFMELLAGLCSNIDQPSYVFGRPRLPLADMVYAGALKVYSGFSARRFDTDIKDATRRGYLDVAPSFNSVNRYISDGKLTPLITDLIEKSAAPLASVEHQFAADATGFSTSRFDRWFDHKWGKEKSYRKYLKAHAIVGVKTNIVTSIRITESTVHDIRVLPELLALTNHRFNMTEVSADKAYLSDAVLKMIESYGAEPYIPFKSNTTGKGSKRWMRAYSYFMLNQDDFKAHYHKRSNVETTFSMVKSKFGDSVRAKSETGQANEILLKFLAHNIVVLIHEMHELGVAPTWGMAA